MSDPIQGCLVLNDKQLIDLFRLKTIARGLKLEIETGMRHSKGSVFTAAKGMTGQKTREKCYRALVEMIQQQEEALVNTPEQ
jgi:hypothetical protein